MGCLSNDDEGFDWPDPTNFVCDMALEELKCTDYIQGTETPHHSIINPLNGEIWILEKRLYAVEGSMAQARKNVGASTCWKGYKAQGTKKKGGKTVPNCVKAGDELTHDGEELEEGKKGLYANIHAKRKRGEPPAKPGHEDYPAKDAFKKAAKTAKKEEVELTEKKLDPVGSTVRYEMMKLCTGSV